MLSPRALAQSALSGYPSKKFGAAMSGGLGSSTDATTPMVAPAVPLSQKSFLHLNLMLCFNFANGMMLGSYMLLVLPTEAQRFHEDGRSVVLGFLMFIAGATQLINPLVGLLSDRCTSLLGRRRPFIIAGGIVGVLGILVQDYASTRVIPELYCAAFAVSMLSLNTVYTAVVGIVPDLVPPEQTGLASGIVAFHGVLGANCGFAVHFLGHGSLSDHLHKMYIAYAVVSASCIVLTVISCKETPMTPMMLSRIASLGKRYSDSDGNVVVDTSITWSEVASCFYLDTARYSDFALVFCSRTLYYVACSAQVFFRFYLKDVVGVDDPDHVIVMTAIIGQCVAMITALPAGLMSDQFGRMRKPFLYGACAALACGNIGNCYATDVRQVYVIGALMGGANGIYIAMDAALARDTLPSEKDAARLMGIWGIGCFLGGALGPAFAGPLLMLYGHSPENHSAYNYHGYVAILLISSICFALSGLTLRGVTQKPASLQCQKNGPLGVDKDTDQILAPGSRDAESSILGAY
eukprot:TRINITY_DN25742_c0_g4_i1.p1 TRINITY_DN25742_c0_g4~~TRINITY_DN25742_c0_g4_i1.p1  ORF type:complete len:521 (+),score=52.90 TRINITY_DN25742_c0_g4_i1:29-1591(+)